MQLIHELYKAILFDKLDINEGMIMENVVAQMLRTSGQKLGTSYILYPKDVMEKYGILHLPLYMASLL